MKSTFVFVFLFLLFTTAAKAQEAGSQEPNAIVRLSLISPALLIEQKLKADASLSYCLFTSYGYSNPNDKDFYLGFRVEPRYFFNQEHRKSQGKRTDYLSGGYLGVPMTVGISRSPFFEMGPLIGFQRTLGNRGFWHIGFGAGFSTHKGKTYIGPIGSLGLGFILN